MQSKIEQNRTKQNNTEQTEQYIPNRPIQNKQKKQ